MALRAVEKFEPVTLGHIRSYGGSINCSHSALIIYPMRLLSGRSGRKWSARKCRHRGADAAGLVAVRQQDV